MKCEVITYIVSSSKPSRYLVHKAQTRLKAKVKNINHLPILPKDQLQVFAVDSGKHRRLVEYVINGRFRSQNVDGLRLWSVVVEVLYNVLRDNCV